MNTGAPSKVTRRRQLRAVGLGILVGVLLTTVFEFAKATLTSSPQSILSPSAVAEATFLFSLADALIIVAVSLPIWLFATRLHLNSPVTAAVLGFVLTLTVWVLEDYPPFQPIISGLPYAVFGAVAGLTIWWSSHLR